MRALVERQQQEIGRQQQEIERLLQLLEEALGKVAKGKQPEIKPSTPKSRMHGPWPLRKKRAAAFNHGRPRMEPTETRTHELEHCPTCGDQLVGGNIASSRAVIDIPAKIPVRVTEHQTIRRKCMGCDAWHAPRVDLSAEVSGKQRFGHNLVAWVCYLKQRMRLPFGKIKELVHEQTGLQISSGELVAMIQHTAAKGKDAGQQLAVAICNTRAVYADETSWREGGRNGYVWVITTANGLSLFAFAFSRATAVIEELLPNYAGTLISDFYAVYNFIGANRQRCWAHLKRDIRELREKFAEKHPDIGPWTAALEQTYSDARNFVEKHPDASKQLRQQMASSLDACLHRLSERWLHVRDHPASTMCQRVRRHEDELFQFVRQAGIESTNNRSERVLRPLVIARKISGGTRSETGTAALMLLHSLATSWAARGLSVLDSFRDLARGLPPALNA